VVGFAAGFFEDGARVRDDYGVGGEDESRVAECGVVEGG